MPWVSADQKYNIWKLWIVGIKQEDLPKISITFSFTFVDITVVIWYSEEVRCFEWWWLKGYHFDQILIPQFADGMQNSCGMNVCWSHATSFESNRYSAVKLSQKFGKYKLCTGITDMQWECDECVTCRMMRDALISAISFSNLFFLKNM